MVTLNCFPFNSDAIHKPHNQRGGSLDETLLSTEYGIGIRFIITDTLLSFCGMATNFLHVSDDVPNARMNGESECVIRPFTCFLVNFNVYNL